MEVQLSKNLFIFQLIVSSINYVSVFGVAQQILLFSKYSEDISQY